ncbi:hypothetical protein [Niallia sp. FSL W8-0954]|uniref:hypothetical protein n=1 Tax=Niallia sp. FSL W8-0954 TaxID=2975338 RepID=UPI0030F7D353
MMLVVWLIREGVWLIREGVWLIREGVWLIREGVWLIREEVWLIRGGVWLIREEVWLISAKLAFNIFSYSEGKKGTDPKNNKKPISHSDIPRRIGSF